MIHVYTGNGKGKTTAALGLAIRAAMAGKQVYMGQFIKGMDYSELKIVDHIDNFQIQQFGRDCFIEKEPSQEDIRIAKEGLGVCQAVIEAGEMDVVILDELNIALYFKLFSLEELMEVLEKKPEDMELIITGRYAPRELIERADLVTEMLEVKHYYNDGVEARLGIEF